MARSALADLAQASPCHQSVPSYPPASARRDGRVQPAAEGCSGRLDGGNSTGQDQSHHRESSIRWRIRFVFAADPRRRSAGRWPRSARCRGRKNFVIPVQRVARRLRRASDFRIGQDRQQLARVLRAVATTWPNYAIKPRRSLISMVRCFSGRLSLVLVRTHRCACSASVRIARRRSPAGSPPWQIAVASAASVFFRDGHRPSRSPAGSGRPHLSFLNSRGGSCDVAPPPAARSDRRRSTDRASACERRNDRNTFTTPAASTPMHPGTPTSQYPARRC